LVRNGEDLAVSVLMHYHCASSCIHSSDSTIHNYLYQSQLILFIYNPSLIGDPSHNRSHLSRLKPMAWSFPSLVACIHHDSLYPHLISVCTFFPFRLPLPERYLDLVLSLSDSPGDSCPLCPCLFRGFFLFRFFPFARKICFAFHRHLYRSFAQRCV